MKYLRKISRQLRATAVIWALIISLALLSPVQAAEFGTGILKVTPAHDKVDFEIGQRHKLPIVDVLTETGRINCPAAPELHGLDRFEARKRAAELLQEKPTTSNSRASSSALRWKDALCSGVAQESRVALAGFGRAGAAHAAPAIFLVVIGCRRISHRSH